MVGLYALRSANQIEKDDSTNCIAPMNAYAHPLPSVRESESGQ